MNLCMTALLSVVSTAAWALSEVGGVYQIGTAEDLKAFAELVNGDNPYANAVLTADIDKGTENYRIGRDGQDFQGFFDGAGHTITYDMTFEENGAGLFRNVGVHAVIQNLKVQGTITTSAQFAGSIAGWNSGRIRGCYADVTINSSKEGDATDGAWLVSLIAAQSSRTVWQRLPSWVRRLRTAAVSLVGLTTKSTLQTV